MFFVWRAGFTFTSNASRKCGCPRIILWLWSITSGWTILPSRTIAVRSWSTSIPWICRSISWLRSIRIFLSLIERSFSSSVVRVFSESPSRKTIFVHIHCFYFLMLFLCEMCHRKTFCEHCWWGRLPLSFNSNFNQLFLKILNDFLTSCFDYIPECLDFEAFYFLSFFIFSSIQTEMNSSKVIFRSFLLWFISRIAMMRSSSSS